MSPSFFQKKSFICLDTTVLHAWIYESRWAATLCFRSSLQPEKYLRSWNIKNVWQAEARGGKQKECQVDRRPMHFKKQTLMSDKEMLKRCHYRLTSASKRIRHNRWQYISIAARHWKATLFWFAYTIYEFDGLNEKMVLRDLKTFNFRMKRDRLTMYFDKNFEHFKLSFPLHVLSRKKAFNTAKASIAIFCLRRFTLFIMLAPHTRRREEKSFSFLMPYFVVFHPWSLSNFVQRGAMTCIPMHIFQSRKAFRYQRPQRTIYSHFLLSDKFTTSLRLVWWWINENICGFACTSHDVFLEC